MTPPKEYEEFALAVVKAAAEYIGVGYLAVLGNRKYKEHSIARAIIYRILTAHGTSTTVLGHVLGCDHSNIVKQKRICRAEDVSAVLDKIKHLVPPMPWVPVRRKVKALKDTRCPNCHKQGTAHVDLETPGYPKFCIKCDYQWPSKPTPAFQDRE